MTVNATRAIPKKEYAAVAGAGTAFGENGKHQQNAQNGKEMMQ